MYDINEDGKVDVSMTYQDGGGRWWLNNSTPGTVNFTATNITRGGNTARSQVMIDFNGDGKVDWLRSAPPGLVVDFGNGTGGFTEGSLTFTVPGTTSNENASFLPADFDDDGDIDLLVLTGGGYDGTLGKTSYWRNNGNLTFTDVTASAGIPHERHDRQGDRRLRPGRRHGLHRHREQVDAAGHLPEQRPGRVHQEAGRDQRRGSGHAWTTAPGARRSRPISTTTASSTSS